jgi:hypothetical protein
VAETYYSVYDQLYEAKDSSAEDLDTLLLDMLTGGVHDAYYDMYQGIDGNPLLGALVDDFVQQILDQCGDYDPNWLDNPEWLNDLNRFLDDSREGRTIRKRILSLDVIEINGDAALLVACPQDLFIISPQGELLWTKSYNGWAYEDPFFRTQPNAFVMDGDWEICYRSLGDLNQDGVDDLLACSYAGIYTTISSLDGDNLGFKTDDPDARPLFTSGPGDGMDPQQVTLVDDVDGDSVM